MALDTGGGTLSVEMRLRVPSSLAFCVSPCPASITTVLRVLSSRLSVQETRYFGSYWFCGRAFFRSRSKARRMGTDAAMIVMAISAVLHIVNRTPSSVGANQFASDLGTTQQIWET